MKKLFAILTLFAVVAFISPQISPCQAQIVTTFHPVKDSTVNADFTTILLSVDNTAKSFEIIATKVSGTIAGKAVLEGRAHDGVNWVGIDSIALADQTTNFKVFPLTALSFPAYRFKVTETGTGKLKPIIAYTLKRSGGILAP